MKLNSISTYIRTQGNLLLIATVIAGGAAFASPIINLDATSATASTLTESLTAGTYTVTIVGTSVTGALYNGWNTSYGAATNNLWTDRYGIDVCGGSCNEVVVLDGNPGFATASSALAAYNSAPSLDLYNPTSGTTLTGYGTPYTFTLKSTQNVIFSIPDYGSNWDDTGGESLQLSQVAATPEPGTFGLLGGAALVAGLVFRRRFVSEKA